MFTPRAIGFIRSPYKENSAIPKGLGAKHDAEGVLEVLPEFEAGLKDVEGFSHLFVIWFFNRSEGFDLVGAPPVDDIAARAFAISSASPRVESNWVDGQWNFAPRESIAVRRGVDMLDGTPILDIKPYMSNIPAEKLRRGWLADAEAARR